MYGLMWVFVSLYVLQLTIAGESSNNLVSPDKKYDYDLIVIGGGSGGLAAAKDAYLKYNKRVLVVDYVTPSPQGTHWKEGGTCVNVGCIPKKLMHQAALIGEAVKEAGRYGWEINDPKSIKLNWQTMRQAVQNHVSSTNWVTRTHLRNGSLKKVTDYINGRGEFVDANTIKVTLRDEEQKQTGKLSTKTKTVTGEKILIAVGGRPNYPPIEGAKELAITSDDLFSLKDPPGNTLIIGAGYISLEVAGFLRGMGMDVTVMVRSEVLRGFDRQMAAMVKAELQFRGVTFLNKTETVSIAEESKDVTTQNKNGGWRKKNIVTTKRQLCVKWKTTTEKGVEEGKGYFDTVLIAAGRRARTSELKVKNANIKVETNGKINADDEEKTNVPNIYAVGDVLYNKPELSPVAIHAGKLLVARLYGGSKVLMDYHNVPTTVFTPQEYSFVGLSEEQAIKQYGQDNIEVYHTKFTPLEYSIPHKGKARCYLKVICKREGDQQILGMHFFAPSAGEVMQGYAAALKAGLTFKQLQGTVGIHPTMSEEFTRVYITKRSGTDPTPQTCCS